MKLTIEKLTHFTPQDTLDLTKIWPDTDITLLNARLSGSFAVFAARFNDRLLAAVQVIIDNEWNEARLIAPLVRDVTRRRGVGLYLINETQRLLPEINHWWLANNQSLGDAMIMAKFMAACGFSQEPDGWHKRR
ncbi:aspartate 1-decarboxylase autocleavage activator PanM [Acerihabitans sp. TG2]|uniref:aspartate 1-decarboxylase autocleavage activator PanM n=1 Tax=Acerihabitans sp. TG2 TaxID=3096008 RepID=UPI002B2298E2|nr:aspartate 1-decarboxylase autocleavage activator PanM [Acerihabitans sp. TG2]MEA9389856.1 aspartate 1-decarboxylase autocleavage activator PanM [Acerihabitans sp. TG2]